MVDVRLVARTELRVEATVGVCATLVVLALATVVVAEGRLGALWALLRKLPRLPARGEIVNRTESIIGEI